MNANATLRVGIAAWLAVIVIGLIAGCSHQSAPAQNPSQGAPGQVGVAPNQGAPQEPAKIMVYVLAPKTAAGQSAADPNGLVAEPLPGSNHLSNPATAAIEALTTGTNSPLPSGTKLLALTVDPTSRLATVNFSKQFQTNFLGGETREAQSVDSVLETLGQFPDVRNVQFLVAGRKIDSLGGTLELDQPLPTPSSGLQIASSTAN
jgi:spore germination protein GerM